jgi:hypothetical protein
VTPAAGTPIQLAQQSDRFEMPDAMNTMLQQMEQQKRQQEMLQQQLLLRQMMNPGASFGQAPIQTGHTRPNFDTTQLQGAALAKQLQPAGAARELFRSATDVSGVASAPAPEGRFENGHAPGDLVFQRTTRGLIDRGIINEHSFVLMDTGHVIPQADELLRASGLRAAGVHAEQDVRHRESR